MIHSVSIQNARGVYEKNYETLFYIQDENGPSALSVPRDGRDTCRFCRLGDPVVSFKNECHALPESIGNHYLLSEDECDCCNQFFGIGGGIEDHLAKWSLPYRVISGICGKNGIPSIKREHSGWRVDSPSFLNLNMSMRAEQMIVKQDESRNSLLIEIPRDSFVPTAVFKAFVKMAIALLPRDELDNFTGTIDWLLEPNHTIPTNNLHRKILYSQIPTVMPQGFLIAALARRIAPDLDMPYLVLVLAVANYIFQIPIPCATGLQNQMFTMTYFPLMFGPDNLNPVVPLVMDLSGTEKVRDELVSFSFIFGSVIHEHISRHDNIATKAYYLWLADGAKEGHDLDFWLEAEKIEEALLEHPQNDRFLPSARI